MQIMVKHKRFLESNASSILNLNLVPGIEETFDSRNLLPSTAIEPKYIHISIQTHPTHIVLIKYIS